MLNPQNLATKAIRTALETDTQFGAVIPPISLSTNYTFAGLDQKRTYDYTRSGNPTRDHLAETLAALEGGSGAVVTSTGMSAILLCLHLLKPQDTLLVPNDCYGGTFRLFDHLGRKGHFKLRFFDPRQRGVNQLIRDTNPAMVWIETPSNPLLNITDIEATCRTARSCGAWSVVDNTFLSPALQQPLQLGADIAVHSTTKYINGHSDVVGGAVIGATKELHEELAWWANCLGITGAPFDSYLTLRGLRTLDARIRIHCDNAQRIAEALDDHPDVGRVYYPGLATHRGHELATRQQSGYGGMISFEIDGDRSRLERFFAHIRCFSLAESLGGVESLIAHPDTMTHAAMVESARRDAGITPNLVRLSVGIEHGDDLLNDLHHALVESRWLKKVAGGYRA